MNVVAGTPRTFVSGHNTRGRLRAVRLSVRCRRCDLVFEVVSGADRNRRTFCSTTCRDAFRAEHRGEEHPSWKRVETTCATCGRSLLVPPNRLQRSGRVYCSATCGNEGRRTRSLERTGEVGKDRARKRDGATCRVCGFSSVVDVHHIVPRSGGGSNDLSNLITLCPNHHAMAHRGLLSLAELREAMP